MRMAKADRINSDINILLVDKDEDALSGIFNYLFVFFNGFSFLFVEHNI